MLSQAVLVASVLLVFGCSAEGPAGPRAPALDEPFRIGVGDVATLAEEGLKVKLLAVESDSRCPVDVTCVWAGDAVLRLELHRPPQAKAEERLHTRADSAQSAHYHGYRIDLLSLEPALRDGVTLRSEDYAATLCVRRDEAPER